MQEAIGSGAGVLSKASIDGKYKLGDKYNIDYHNKSELYEEIIFCNICCVVRCFADRLCGKGGIHRHAIVQ